MSTGLFFISITIINRNNICTTAATFLTQTPPGFNVIIIVANREFNNRCKCGLERNNGIIKITVITNSGSNYIFNANFIPSVNFKFDNISIKLNHFIFSFHRNRYPNNTTPQNTTRHKTHRFTVLTSAYHTTPHKSNTHGVSGASSPLNGNHSQ